jgi:L-ascorbate metabolism protein UlaG (beta-lactamase superfamily)
MISKFRFLTIAGVILMSTLSFKPDNKETFKTSSGKLDITLLGHASLLFQIDNKNIYIDPCKTFIKQTVLPKADVIIITHNHYDHFDPKEIEFLSTTNTTIITPEQCYSIKPSITLKNGQTATVCNVKIEAVPAYNIKHKTEKGEFYHPKGEGNGYVITIGDKKFYVAGDTEDIPEMANLKNIDVAFLPYNLPYTMNINMFENAVKMIKPAIVYPYHYKGADINEIKIRLGKLKSVEVRIRNIY